MIIIIDYREQELIKQITKLITFIPQFKKLTFKVENLLLGDVVLFDEIKGKEEIIIERKSISDLLSSIKDGRYTEQSYRLNGNKPWP